jgi:hypothetical protein
MRNLQLQSHAGYELELLKQHMEWKCMQKKELLALHSSTWEQNGLSNLKYTVLHRQAFSATQSLKVMTRFGAQGTAQRTRSTGDGGCGVER